MDSGHGTVKPKGSKSSTRRRRRYFSTYPNSEGSSGDSSSSSHKSKRKRRYRNNSWDEFKKAKPPMFDGEIKNDQEAKAWLLCMRKYFQA